MDMENQNGVIPEHLANRWEEVSKSLGEASTALVEANEAYHRAIVARLAISTELKNWQMKEYFGVDDFIK